MDAPQSAEPQAILTPITKAAIFLVLTVGQGGEGAVRDLLAGLGGLRRSVGFRRPEDGLECVVGVGSLLWDRLFDGPRPAGLHPLPELAGAAHTAVSTPGDLLFHIRAQHLDLCFELGGHITAALAGSAQAVEEVHGFRSFDDRDVLGFVDGTENPEGGDALASVLIGEEDPGFAGGSYVVVQRYLHDLDAWEELSVEEQERAIGRRKLSDVEMDDDEKPANSHLALNTIVDDDGQERQIVRFNMPFGRVGAREFGTYFIGYARSPDLIELMLTNMFVGDPPGNHDRILDFSEALSGALFFVPSASFLEDSSTPPAASSEGAGTGAAQPGAGGSLGIGGLRGTRAGEGA